MPSSSTDSTSTTSTATPVAASALSSRPSNLPPLVISPGSVFGGHFTNSPMASPATPHGGLSSIAEFERQSSGRISPVDNGTEAGGDGDDSEEGEGANAELERGAEIKSGFLIKKQERRKVRSGVCYLRHGSVSDIAALEEEVVRTPSYTYRLLQGQPGEFRSRSLLHATC